MDTGDTFNGISLIDQILEFVAYVPNESYWNYRMLIGDNLRLIKFMRINSLLRAFSLTANKNDVEKDESYLNLDLRVEIKSILRGDFIQDRDKQAYHELTEFVKRYFQEKNERSMDISIGSGILGFIYPKMINYKIKLREIIGFNSNVQEAGIPFARFHVELTNSISSNLVNKYGDLDHVMNLIVNPGQLVFTKRELIEKFGYPPDDLYPIDWENF